MVKSVARPALVLIFFVVGSVHLPRAQAQSRIADARAEIMRVAARRDSISRQRNADAEAAFYTEDAVVSLGGADDIRGRDALWVAMRQFYERNVVQVHQLDLNELEVYGDIAYSRGTYLFVAGPPGQLATTDRGRYMAVWHRGNDGTWRIHRYLENLLPSPVAK